MNPSDRSSQESLHEQRECSDDPEDGDPFDYTSVPLEIAGTLKVRYIFVGKLEPMPYDWDD